MAITKTVNVETTNARATTELTDTTPTVPLPDMPQGLMVVGPQVTLHFVEGDWNQANSYDYYDVVQVDGTSYIAVQDVPMNTPITNTEYWAKWNDPNSQVELLQQTVGQFDNRISANAAAIKQIQSELKTFDNAISDIRVQNLGIDEIVVLGNSYEMGANNVSNQGIGYQLKNILGISSDKFHFYAVSSAGFSVTGNTYDMQLARASEEMSETQKNNVKMVYVPYTITDYREGTTGLKLIFENFAANVSAVFPNAIIVMPLEVCMSYDYKDTVAGKNYGCDIFYLAYISMCLNQASAPNLITMPYIWCDCMINDGTLVQADGYHPTLAASKAIAARVVNNLISSSNRNVGRYYFYDMIGSDISSIYITFDYVTGNLSINEGSVNLSAAPTSASASNIRTNLLTNSRFYDVFKSSLSIFNRIFSRATINDKNLYVGLAERKSPDSSYDMVMYNEQITDSVGQRFIIGEYFNHTVNYASGVMQIIQVNK